MKRLCCLLLLLALLTVSARAETIPNWYEVFVRSYQDSNGDGLGDLNGLRARLDYIEAMGWRGLWLMPVMPSPSYHKYDVTDYMAVDPEYGTLEDLRALAEDCHSRGIAIIIDLPVNHTSTLHPWFLSAGAALLAGETSPYVDYYHFQQQGGGGFVPLGESGWYYEEQFAGGAMPDLNLDNDAVRAELAAVFDFWLRDVGVDGFRLDAVTSYYTGDTARNIAFLAWVKRTCGAIKPGAFLVGECWTGLSTIAEYYQSGIDSFFLFPASQAEGFVVKSLSARNGGAKKFVKGYQGVLDAIPEGFLTPFLSNHDTGRTVGLVQGRANPDAVKFAHGLLGTMQGGVFTYYGEEIGMVGSGDDPNKRLAMYWSDGDMTERPPGVTHLEYAYPCVEDQLADPGSLLNYLKAVNQMRLANPVISTGANEMLLTGDTLLLMRRSDGSESRLIAINFGKSADEMTLESSCAIVCDLETGAEAAALDGSTLTLPGRAIVILSEE